MQINSQLTLKSLDKDLTRFFEVAQSAMTRLHKRWKPEKGSPVYTRAGKYDSRGWTEWTQGFMYGIPLLVFDATGDKAMWQLGKEGTTRHMAPHLTHIGVHDHGFNNVSTYGNLRRLALEGKSGEGKAGVETYELALKLSGAVQAARWTTIHDGTGYICSFNGPQSLFSDTIRSCRSLVLADLLGHVLMGENDKPISLMDRAVQHIQNTLRYNVYYGKGRDHYDLRGRVVHESIFNTNDGNYRCPSTQQGYSPFSTWTRGLAWILTGCAEQLEFWKKTRPGEKKSELVQAMEEAAKATADFHIAHSCADGIPFWDTGAPGLAKCPDYPKKKSRPDNPWEPVDSSAAAIAAQGFLRLGQYLGLKTAAGKRYWQAGLTMARTLFRAPYLAEDPKHEGLLLHSIYHQPNGWDYVPKGGKVPHGESCMWGDYHGAELALYLYRQLKGEPYYTFFAPWKS